MSDEIKGIFDESSLLGAPVMRAAYSDRTAWLMSAMSQLAYYQFEDSAQVTSLATELASMSGVDDIEARLKEILDGTMSGGNEEVLRDILKMANFELIRTYNRSETQAFLAKRSHTSGKGMLVLAFRGTEKKIEDISSDLKAGLTTLRGEEKVHRGFLQAFNHVADAVQKDLSDPNLTGIPVYITGHSLGGALAIMATRLLASDSHGACYTFGGPRVGNASVDDQIKTPIYRVVNSADAVPRVPPSFTINILIFIFDTFNLKFISRFLGRFKGYAHYGDMRYLTHAEEIPDGRYPNLKLHSNPIFPVRAVWVIKRLIATGFKAGATDHSISLYRRKLRSYALDRQSIGKPVVLPETETEEQNKE